jgi:hypothetical protein
VEPLAKSTEGLKAGWVDNYVSIGLLVFAVFVFVPFVCCSSVGGDGCDSHCVRVAARNVDEVVRYMFAAEGDNIET